MQLIKQFAAIHRAHAHDITTPLQFVNLVKTYRKVSVLTCRVAMVTLIVQIYTGRLTDKEKQRSRLKAGLKKIEDGLLTFRPHFSVIDDAIIV